MSLWYNLYDCCVEWAKHSRRLWGVTSTLQPAAFMFPTLILAHMRTECKTLLEVLAKDTQSLG